MSRQGVSALAAASNVWRSTRKSAQPWSRDFTALLRLFLRLLRLLTIVG
jgi:hypothetical protein